MIYLIYISLSYLLITSIIFWMNKQDFKYLYPSGNDQFSDKPLVSICIPARNEERVIERSALSALNQNYPKVEVIVLDDKSTDATPKVLDRIQKNNHEKLYIIEGNPKPDNWIGKPWACHQLSKKASGELLLFIDADVWLEPDAVNRIVQSMHHQRVDFVTVWPLQKLDTFWEKVVIPIVYYSLFTLLPARYVHRKPQWLPSSLEKKFASSFAAACGQCMVFTRKVYQAIGGHQSVKDVIVEDVALAKQIKQKGFSMRMYHGHGAVHCRMYTSENEIWRGFRKNFLALHNNSIPAFIFMGVLNLIVYVVPFFTLLLGIILQNLTLGLLSAIAGGLIIIHRIVLARWYRWELSYAVTHPLGVLWFLKLGLRVLTDYFLGISPQWKGRSREK